MQIRHSPPSTAPTIAPIRVASGPSGDARLADTAASVVATMVVEDVDDGDRDVAVDDDGADVEDCVDDAVTEIVVVSEVVVVFVVVSIVVGNGVGGDGVGGDGVGANVEHSPMQVQFGGTVAQLKQFDRFTS